MEDHKEKLRKEMTDMTEKLKKEMEDFVELIKGAKKNVPVGSSPKTEGGKRSSEQTRTNPAKHNVKYIKEDTSSDSEDGSENE